MSKAGKIPGLATGGLCVSESELCYVDWPTMAFAASVGEFGVSLNPHFGVVQTVDLGLLVNAYSHCVLQDGPNHTG